MHLREKSEYRSSVRRAFCLAAFVAGATAVAVSAASHVKVASGVFGGVPWTLLAQDNKSGSYCITLRLGGTPTSTCNRLNLSGAGGVSYFGHPGRPGPDYWVGPITSEATRVAITYPDGRRFTVRTISAPPGLAANMSFFVYLTPCRTSRPKRIAGLDSAGRVVASVNIDRGRSPLAC